LVNIGVTVQNASENSDFYLNLSAEILGENLKEKYG
jgi:hypothetical protein